MEDAGEQLERLEEMIDSVLERLERVDRPLPLVLTRKQAARELSISLSTLKAMIASGEVAQTLPLGKHRGIPRSEILRLATPTQPKTSTRRKPAPKTTPKDAREQAAEFRAQLRRRS